MSFVNQELVFFWACQKTENIDHIIQLQYNPKGFSLNVPEEKLKSVQQEYENIKPVNLKKLQEFIQQLECKPVQLLAFLFAIDNGMVNDYYYEVPKKYQSQILGPSCDLETAITKTEFKNIEQNVFGLLCADENHTYLINSYGKVFIEGGGIITSIPKQNVSLEILALRTIKDKIDLLIVGKRSIFIYKTMDLQGFEPTFVNVYKIGMVYALVYGKVNQETGEEQEIFCAELKIDKIDESFLSEIDEASVSSYFDSCKERGLSLWNKRISKDITKSRIYNKNVFIYEGENVSSIFGNEDCIFKAYNNGELFMNNKKIMDVPVNLVSFCCLNLK